MLFLPFAPWPLGRGFQKKGSEKKNPRWIFPVLKEKQKDSEIKCKFIVMPWESKFKCFFFEKTITLNVRMYLNQQFHGTFSYIPSHANVRQQKHSYSGGNSKETVFFSNRQLDSQKRRCPSLLSLLVAVGIAGGETKQTSWKTAVATLLPINSKPPKPA